MASQTIDKPIINSPFEEPQRHFRFTDTGITHEIVSGRRKSTYFIPIAKPKLQPGGQAALDLGVESRAEENRLINDIRERVALWRQQGFYPATRVSRRLLEHWTRPDRERRLFFCQIEALETLIYLTEIAPTHDGDHGRLLLKRLAQAVAQATPDGRPTLPRLAMKMATGSGKPW